MHESPSTPGHLSGIIHNMDTTESVRHLIGEVTDQRALIDSQRAHLCDVRLAIAELELRINTLSDATSEAIVLLDARLSAMESAVETLLAGRRLV